MRVSTLGDSCECKFISFAPTIYAILLQISQVCIISHAEFPLNLYELSQRTGNCGQKTKDDLIGEKVRTDLGATSEPHVLWCSRRGRFAFYLDAGGTGESVIGGADFAHYTEEFRQVSSDDRRHPPVHHDCFSVKVSASCVA